MGYGTAPLDLGYVDTGTDEMLYYQYLPIRFPNLSQYKEGQGLAYKLPERLEWVRDMLMLISPAKDHYVYLTAKRLWISPDNKGNRRGWHSDGFLTKDINYIWYDCLPTEFAVQPMELTEDHNISMREMEEQVDIRNIVTYPNRHLIKLSPENVHRVNESNVEGFRTFVKISVSKEKYNLRGNSHNHLFDYSWDMVERKLERNCPIGRQTGEDYG